jgi:hypothetical protein
MPTGAGRSKASSSEWMKYDDELSKSQIRLLLLLSQAKDVIRFAVSFKRSTFYNPSLGSTMRCLTLGAYRLPQGEKSLSTELPFFTGKICGGFWLKGDT